MPDVTPILPFADLTDLGPRQRRLALLSYPRYYRAPGTPSGWGLTVEAFARAESPWVARAAEGVHSLAVRNDGLCVLDHCGHRLTFRLRGIVAAGADGQFLDAIPIDLSAAAWKLDASRLDLGVVAWDHGSGARYEIRYGADSVTDRLVLTDILRSQLRAKLPAKAARFGLAFDLSLPAAMATANVETEASIQLAAGMVRQRLVPSWIPDSRLSPSTLNSLLSTSAAGWRERWAIVGGRLVQSLDLAALDGAEELRTTVVYQQGTDGYSGCGDAFIDSFVADNSYRNNYGASTIIQFARWSGRERRQLIKFDLSALSGVTAVNSATLQVYCDANYWRGTYPKGVSAARVLRDWGVGTANGTYQAGGCCWDWAITPSGDWTTNGCDGEATDRTAFGGSATIPAATGWASWDVAAHCTAWLVDGAPNYGLLLAQDNDEVASTGESSDSATTAIRPILNVDFATGGTPQTIEVSDAMAGEDSAAVAVAVAIPEGLTGGDAQASAIGAAAADALSGAGSASSAVTAPVSDGLAGDGTLASALAAELADALAGDGSLASGVSSELSDGLAGDDAARADLLAILADALASDDGQAFAAAAELLDGLGTLDAAEIGARLAIVIEELLGVEDGVASAIVTILTDQSDLSDASAFVLGLALLDGLGAADLESLAASIVLGDGMAVSDTATALIRAVIALLEARAASTFYRARACSTVFEAAHAAAIRYSARAASAVFESRAASTLFEARKP